MTRRASYGFDYMGGLIIILLGSLAFKACVIPNENGESGCSVTLSDKQDIEACAAACTSGLSRMKRYTPKFGCECEAPQLLTIPE